MSSILNESPRLSLREELMCVGFEPVAGTRCELFYWIKSLETFIFVSIWKRGTYVNCWKSSWGYPCAGELGIKVKGWNGIDEKVFGTLGIHLDQLNKSI